MKPTNSNEQLPTAARLTRVTDVLTANSNKYGKWLADRSVEVAKRDGTTVRFAPAVMRVAVAIQQQGKDACTCQKADILACADTLLCGGLEVATTQSRPETSCATTVLMPETQPMAITPAPSPSHGDVDAGLSGPFAIYSLLQMAAHLSADYDSLPGHEKRLELMNTAAEEYRVLLS